MARRLARSRVSAARNELGDERIVVDRDLATFDHSAVDANTGHHRLSVQQKRSGLREIVLRRVLCVDPDFYRVPTLRQLTLRPRERFAGGDRELCQHDIDAGGLFRDRMLDLQARVHLEEIEPRLITRALEQKLDGSRIAISRSARECHGSFAHPRSKALASMRWTALPRRSSDAGAGANTRARTGKPRRRGGRAEPEPRRGAGDR